jgi:hypothetical protein
VPALVAQVAEEVGGVMVTPSAVEMVSRVEVPAISAEMGARLRAAQVLVGASPVAKASEAQPDLSVR